MCCTQRNGEPRVARKTVFAVFGADGEPVEVWSSVWEAKKSAGAQGLTWRTTTMLVNGSDPLHALVAAGGCRACGG